jgi:hypothetical protein
MQRFYSRSEYDLFTGKPVARWGWVLRDRAGNPLREGDGVKCLVRTYIEVGRPAPVAPVDPNASLIPTPLDTREERAAMFAPSLAAAQRGIAAKRRRRHQEITAAIRDLLLHSPGLTGREVHRQIGTSTGLINLLLNRGPFRSVQVGCAKQWYVHRSS